MNHHSTIDYMLTSSSTSVFDFHVLDPDINFSDHLPILSIIDILVERKDMSSNTITAPPIQLQLRWDRADLISYYQFTGLHLAPILTSIDSYLACYEQLQLPDCTLLIDNIYTSIVNVLTNGANQFVPHCPKNFFKFWWDEELDLLKDASVDSNRVWKAAGKPKSGPIFDKRQ